MKHCLTIANGDIDRATQILLHRQENNLCISQNNSLTLNLSNKAHVINDDELKNRIIERYSYVDKDSENKEHKPLAPKTEPKKLVRYRDNKIVSLKGLWWYFFVVWNAWRDCFYWNRGTLHWGEEGRWWRWITVEETEEAPLPVTTIFAAIFGRSRSANFGLY